jgi:cytochrome oxidase assembly protein ShyY1
MAFHLLCLAAIVLMVNLGFWQLRRLDERKEFNAEVTARTTEPALPLEELLAEPDFEPDQAEWRPVTAAGTWLPDQVVVFNRSLNGRPGDDVLTALELDDGQVVFVNRGFVPVGAEVPVPPSGGVEVLGTVRASEVRRRGGLTDSDVGTPADPLTEIRRIEIPRLAPQIEAPVVPVFLDLIESDPDSTAADPEPIPLPELSNGPHLGYAFQWFIFAACVAVGWALAVRRSLAKRRADPARRSTQPEQLSV